MHKSLQSWMDIFWALWRKTLYKYPWDEKSALISVVGMSKEAICFSRSWVGTAELGHWCQNHTYKFCQVNPNWACHFELSIHKPKIRFKSSLTKVTTSHFSKDVIKHYILIILLLRCSTHSHWPTRERNSDSALYGKWLVNSSTKRSLSYEIKTNLKTSS